jgi:hypothetical protein
MQNQPSDAAMRAAQAIVGDFEPLLGYVNDPDDDCSLTVARHIDAEYAEQARVAEDNFRQLVAYLERARMDAPMDEFSRWSQALELAEALRPASMAPAWSMDQ